MKSPLLSELSLANKAEKIKHSDTGLVRKIPNKQVTSRFLKGPVALSWLIAASNLPGKASSVGIVIWYRSGLLKKKTFTLSTVILREFGVSRHSKSRALKSLQQAKLIHLEPREGKNPVITILDIETNP